MSVCLSAWMSKNYKSKFHQIFCPLPAAVARSFSEGSAICYVLPVLCMMSCLDIIEWIGQNQRWCVRFVQFARWWHWGQSLPSPSYYFFTSLHCQHKNCKVWSRNLGHLRPESLKRSSGLQRLLQCWQSGGNAACHGRDAVIIHAAS